MAPLHVLGIMSHFPAKDFFNFFLPGPSQHIAGTGARGEDWAKADVD
jgi:hypothetical protein